MPTDLHRVRDNKLADWESHVLAEEIIRLRNIFRWILAQRGDDLCWRDFYVRIADALPPKEVHLEELILPPREVFLKNCDRFEASLRGGPAYVPTDGIESNCGSIAHQRVEDDPTSQDGVVVHRPGHSG